MSTALLIQRIGSVFADLPDTRGKSNNPRYAMKDAALAAFSIVFTQSPSFLDSQVRMQKKQGKNNASSLFGAHPIPSDNPIRNLLDPVPPDTLFGSMTTIGDELYRGGPAEGDTRRFGRAGTEILPANALAPARLCALFFCAKWPIKFGLQ